MNKIEFGNYFKNLRKNNNLSLKDVSDCIFVSIQAINKYEKGISYPDTMVLGDLAKLFKVDFDSFVNLKYSCDNDYSDKYKFDIDKFSKQFAYLRKYNNLSLSQLADNLKVQYQTISKWEKGESLPNIEQLKICAGIFNITPSQLYFCIDSTKEKVQAPIKITKNHIQNIIIAVLSTVIITSSIFLLIGKFDSGPSSSNSSIIINPIRKPFDVDAKIEINYFNVNDPSEIQEQSIIEYNGKFSPSTAIEYSYNNIQFDVFACNNGKVTAVKQDPLFGNMIYLEDDENYVYIYGSLDNIQIKIGDIISSGTKIANAGTNTIHENLNNHLHFGIIDPDNQRIDPETFFENKIKNN